MDTRPEDSQGGSSLHNYSDNTGAEGFAAFVLNQEDSTTLLTHHDEHSETLENQANFGEYMQLGDDPIISSSPAGSTSVPTPPALQPTGTMRSASPAQHQVYRHIAAAVILRRSMGQKETANLLKDYILHGLKSAEAKIYSGMAKAEAARENVSVRSLQWEQSQSLVLIGRAVEAIGEEGEDRERLMELFRSVLEADLDEAREEESR